MNKRIKLYIVGRGEIELNDSFPIAISFSVADLKDITKRSGASSKTISIPGTQNNNKMFAELFDIRSSDYSFDLTTAGDQSYDLSRKYEFILYEDDAKVLDGYMKLIDVVKKPNSNHYSDNVEIVYNIQLYDKVVDFFTIIDSRKLEDIDFNITPHTLTGGNILATSANTWIDVYKYFNFFNGGSQEYVTADFWASIFAKQYVDRIVADAGYHYNTTESSFLNSEPFTKLIIPFQGTLNFKDSETWENEKFYGQKTGDTATNFVFANPTSIINNIDFDNYIFPYYNNYYNEPGDNAYTPQSYGLQNISFKISGTCVYSSTTDGWYGDVRFLPITSAVTRDRIINVPITVYLKRNGSVLQTINAYSELKLPANAKYDPLTPDIEAGVNYTTNFVAQGTFFSAPIYAGDSITIDYKVNPYKAVPANYNYFDYSGETYQSYYGGVLQDMVKFTMTHFINPSGVFTQGNAEWWNNPLGTVTRNDFDLVNINDYIPKNIKQKDFLSNICKMFNLYVDYNTTFDNRLVFKTRDDYYNTSVYKDWSSKIDRKKDITNKYIPELLNRTVKMTYKDSFNEFSKLYNQYYNQPYGQKEIIFDVNYTIGEEKKEFIFNNSPVVYCGNLRTSAAPSKENTELYCLYDGGMKDGYWKFTYNTTTGMTTVGRDQYAYAGHWDDPDYPAFDLNFDSCRSYFIDNPFYTDNNLFNLYHYNTFRNIAEQKMMTAYFYLTGDDIANLKLSDKIIVDNNTFIINKIYDWNPLTTDSTKVELVLFDSIYKVAPTRKKPIRISGGTIVDIHPNINPLVKPGNIIHPGANPTLILGTGNQIANVDGITLINSDNNVIGPNIDDVVLINSNDVAVDDVEKIFAIGLDGNTTTAITSNTFFVNTSNIIMSGDNVTINNVSFSGGGFTLSGDVSVNNISATTIYSGSTNIESLFTPIAGYVWTRGHGTDSIIANNTSGVLADGDYSVAGGNKVKLYDKISVGFGESNTSYGKGSSIFGSNNNISDKGHYSIVAGQANIAYYQGCSVFGEHNFAGDNYCHVEGYYNTSSGAYSFVGGSGNTLQGHAEGSAVIADHDITTDIPWTLYSKNVKVAQNITADTQVYTTGITSYDDLAVSIPSGKTLSLSNVVWRDEFPGSPWVAAAAQAAPDEVNYTIAGVGVRKWSFDGGVTEERLSSNFEIPHDYKEGEPIEVHIHWMPSSNNAGITAWYFDYAYCDVNGAAQTATTLAVSATTSANTQYYHYITSIGYLDPAYNYKLGDIILFNLRRTPTTDTYADDAILLQVALHVPCDTLGSRQTYIK